MKVKQAGKYNKVKNTRKLLALGSCSSWLLAGLLKGLNTGAGFLRIATAGVLKLLKNIKTAKSGAGGSKAGAGGVGVLLRIIRISNTNKQATAGGAYYRQQQATTTATATAQTIAGNRGGRALNILNNSGRASQTGNGGQWATGESGACWLLNMLYRGLSILNILKKFLRISKEKQGEKQQRAGGDVQKSLFYQGFSRADAIDGAYYCYNTAGLRVNRAGLQYVIQQQGFQRLGSVWSGRGLRKTGGTLRRNGSLGGGDYRKSASFLHFWRLLRTPVNISTSSHLFCRFYKGFEVA